MEQILHLFPLSRLLAFHGAASAIVAYGDYSPRRRPTRFREGVGHLRICPLFALEGHVSHKPSHTVLVQTLT